MLAEAVNLVKSSVYTPLALKNQTNDTKSGRAGVLFQIGGSFWVVFLKISLDTIDLTDVDIIT